MAKKATKGKAAKKKPARKRLAKLSNLPRKFLNVYSSGFVCGHPTRTLAEQLKSVDRIALVEVLEGDIETAALSIARHVLPS